MEQDRIRGLTTDSGSQAQPKANHSQQSANKDSTFLSGVSANDALEELKYGEEDVIESEPWKAHDDAINCVTFVKSLNMIATCAFDYHVYIWDCEGDKRERVGSLLLGNKALPPKAKLDAEQRRYKA